MGQDTDKGYPEDWDDDEAYEELVCAICKPTSRHKLDYTFTSRAGYNAHIAKMHTDKTKKPKKLKFSLDSGLHRAPVSCDVVMRDISDKFDEAEKRNSSDDLIEKLTESVEVATMRDRDSETRISGKKDIKMAAKKKTAAKKPAKKTAAEHKVQTAEPVGRDRKILIRLSDDEYNKLQAKAAKQSVSMAMLLRSSFQ